MVIGGGNDYSLMHNYNIPSSLQVRPIEAPDFKQEEKNPIATPTIQVSENVPVPVRERKDAPLEDISLTFNAQEEFDYIGQDKDIRSLDMEKAISDMKKDQVLQQYQYFIGRSQNLVAESPDGAVFAKY